ncbi:MAG: hypothetical protein KDN22_16305, partial [Verrucomicrobiae bacterium]|nr:hypothetical protein [Verrucomicrobiae bacterium]
GVTLGIGFAINDGDLDSPGQSGWGGWGAHAVVGGKTPSETGLVTLGGVATAGNGGPPLIAHFPLDADGNSADGAFVATDTIDVEFGSPGANGNTGTSATFNGTSSVIHHDWSADLNPEGSFTLALWAKSNGGAGAWNSPVTSRHDLATEGETSQGYLIYDSSDTGVWTFWSGNGEDPGNWQTLPSPNPVELGVWQHVTIIYDADEEMKKLYVDGELVAESEDTITPNDTTPFNIGAGQDFGDGFWFDGEIDDIGLWGAALTDDQIAKVMSDGVASLNSDAKLGPIFAPGDAVIGGALSADGTQFEVGLAGTTADTNNWPGGEAPEFAIDGVGQKYLNFAKLNTGVIVTPAAGASIANQIQLWAANDSEPRDPSSFAIYGTNEVIEGEGPFDMADFQLITSGDLELPSTRNAGGDAELLEENSQSLIFSNSASYTTYLVIFPTVKDAANANSMQIADVQLSNIGSVNLLVVSRLRSETSGLSFEVINQEGLTVDKDSIVVTIDGMVVTTTVEDIDGGIRVTYVADPAWLPGSIHPYNLVVKDTNGNSAIRSGEGEAKVKDSEIPYNTPLVGPEGGAGVWGVRYIWGAGSPGSNAGAIKIIQKADDTDFNGQVFDTTAEVANLGGGNGLFIDDEPYPDEVVSGDDGLWDGENFIVLYKGTLRITESGLYTFGVHSDDGFGLRIWGGEFVSVNGNGQLDPLAANTVVHPAPTGDSNTRAVANLAAGDYPVEFFWYENGGGDHGELYFAKGEFLEDADADTWELVGGENLVGSGALPFQITSIVKAGANVTITFQSIEGAGYTIERATPAQLVTGEFEELQDGYEGQAGDTTSFTDTGVAGDEVYYRVRAE